MYKYSIKFTLIISLLCLSASAFSNTITLKGSISKYPITMILEQEYIRGKGHTVIKGSYSYDKYKTPIEISGLNDGKITFEIQEKGASFHLKQPDYECGAYNYSGSWKSDSGKELPVTLETVKVERIVKKGTKSEHKIIRELRYQNSSNEIDTDSYFLIGPHKVDLSLSCDERVGYSELTTFLVNKQEVHSLWWKVDSSAMAHVDGQNTIFMHGLSGEILVSKSYGSKNGWAEYTNHDCSFTSEDSELIEKCRGVNFDFSKALTETKSSRIISVDDNGFTFEQPIVFERILEKMISHKDSSDMFSEIEGLPWVKKSNNE